MDLLSKMLMVGFGGAGGAILRYLITQLPLKNSYNFPVQTLIVNVLATFIIGMVMGHAQKISDWDPRWLLLLKVGFCGGFSTLSSMTVEFFNMNDLGHTFLACGYITLTFAICLLATWFGMYVAGAK